jgi:hypothetical protein
LLQQRLELFYRVDFDFNSMQKGSEPRAREPLLPQARKRLGDCL